MPLFIMLKKCTNACTLRFAGDDFEKATQNAYRLSKELRIASYVLDADQVRNIFADQIKTLNEQQPDKLKGEIALRLPLNFKKFLH